MSLFPSVAHPQGASDGQCTFVVAHYAGMVEYSGEGMMKKNQDNLQADLLDLISGSTSPFLQLLANKPAAAQKAGGEHASLWCWFGAVCLL